MLAPLTTSDDRRKGWRIVFVLGLLAALCFGGSMMLAGCATIEAIRNVDK